MADIASITNSAEIKTILETIQDAIFVIREGRIVYCNRHFVEILDSDFDSVIGVKIGDILAPESKREVEQRYRERVEGKDVPNLVEFNLLKAGTEERVPVMCSIGVSTSDDGTVSTVGTLHDMSETRKMMDELERSAREYRSIIEQMPDTYFRTDMRGKLTMVSPFCYKALGYTRDELVGRNIKILYKNLAERDKVLQAMVANDGLVTQMETAMRHKDGNVVWVSINASFRYDEQGEVIGVEGIARNINEQKVMEDKLRELATVDPLTTLSNREGFNAQMALAIERAKRYKKNITLYFIDLDDFKMINDTLGHSVGDEVLIEVAHRLRALTRKMDIAARMGGDEFVLAFEDDMGRQQAEKKARQLEQAIARPFKPGINIRCSIGFALFPEDGDSLDDMLSMADNAMYVQKRLHKGIS